MGILPGIAGLHGFLVGLGVLQALLLLGLALLSDLCSG